MKVAIITIIDNTNYGTYLQALATCHAINSLGHQAEIINYTRPCMTFFGNWIAIIKDRGVLRWFNRCILHYSKKARELRKRDLDFLKDNVIVTEEYIGYNALLSNPPIADIYMTGSDQVWNSIYNRGIDRSFYLDFVPEGKKRISYASSIGMINFPADEYQDVKRLLLKYSTITVRETSARNILLKMGINSQVVLDPTLLLNSTDWQTVAQKYPFENEPPYLLTYSVEYGEEDSYIKHYAQIIARKKGLKLYHITYGGDPKLNYYDKVFTYATPDQFLQLMLNASFTVVSSFHGTAFSINFNKQFITVSPKKFNTRVKNLLQITGLMDRAVTDCNLNIDKLGSIDYERVNKIIGEERQKSISILSDMLNSG